MALFRGRRRGPGNATSDVERQDSEIIQFEDVGGRSHSMTRGELRDQYLPDQLDSHWHDPDGLSRLISVATNASLIEIALEASSRLYSIDRNPARGAATRADVLRQAGQIDDAREVCRKFEASFGQAGAVLYVLARIEDDANNLEATRHTVWRAVQADPNNASLLDWWIEVETRTGSTTIDDCLRRASEIDHAWLPLLRIARSRSAAIETTAATTVYSEVLNRGGHESSVLLSVIGDLGTAQQFDLIVDLVLPWYNPTRHTSLVGLALLQACIDAKRVRDADSVLVRLGTETDPVIRNEVNALAQQLDAIKSSQIAAPLAANQSLPGAIQAQRAPTAQQTLPPKTHPPVNAGSTDSAAPVSLAAPFTPRQSRPPASTTGSRFLSTSPVHTPAFRDDVGWFSLLASPEFLFAAKPAGPELLAVPMFTEHAGDAVLAGLAVGIPRLVNAALHTKTNTRSQSLLTVDANGVVRLPNGPYAADELRRLLAKQLPLQSLAITGEVSGAGDVRRINLILADRESLQPTWSYAVTATAATLSRAVDELLLAAEEELVRQKLLAPINVPSWFVEPPVYLAAAYVQAEAAIVQLGASANQLLPRSIAEQAVTLLSPVKELAMNHAASSLPRIMYASGVVATASVLGDVPSELSEQLARFIASEPLPGKPLQMLTPLFEKYGLAKKDEAKIAQLAEADLRFADWLSRVDAPLR